MIRETKQKILLLVPLAIITGLLIYSWTTFLLTDIAATWRHYMAPGLFAVSVYLYFKSFTKTVAATGIYLLLATLNVLSVTPEIITVWFRIGPIETPHLQPLSLGFLVLFLVLNFDKWSICILIIKKASHNIRPNATSGKGLAKSKADLHFISYSSLVIQRSNGSNSCQPLLLSFSINYKSIVAPGKTFIYCLLSAIAAVSDNQKLNSAKIIIILQPYYTVHFIFKLT